MIVNMRPIPLHNEMRDLANLLHLHALQLLENGEPKEAARMAARALIMMENAEKLEGFNRQTGCR